MDDFSRADHSLTASGHEQSSNASLEMTASGWPLTFKFDYLKTAATENGHSVVLLPELSLKVSFRNTMKMVPLRRFKEVVFIDWSRHMPLEAAIGEHFENLLGVQQKENCDA